MLDRCYHLALLQPAYVDAILNGAKTVEARLSRNRVPPFGVVNQGDELYLRDVGGEVRAVASVAGVRVFEHLTPCDVDALRLEFGEDVGAPDAFWNERRGSHFATMLCLEKIRPQETLLEWRSRVPAGSRSGWHLLDGPLMSVGSCSMRSTG